MYICIRYYIFLHPPTFHSQSQSKSVQARTQFELARRKLTEVRKELFELSETHQSCFIVQVSKLARSVDKRANA